MVNTSPTPLQTATHMLEQHHAFQAWSQSYFPRWHQKWLGSLRTKPVVEVFLGLTVLFGLGIMALGVAFLSPILAAGGASLTIVSGATLITMADANISLSNILNSIVSHHSKKFGVLFKSKTPDVLWGAYPQEQKTRLLSKMAQLDQHWDGIKSRVLSLINTPDLPYVWWQNMEHTIVCAVNQQHQQTAHQRNEQEFARIQSQIQLQIQPALDVQINPPQQQFDDVCVEIQQNCALHNEVKALKI